MGNNNNWNDSAWRSGWYRRGDKEVKLRPLWILVGVILRDVIHAVIAVMAQQQP